MRLARPFTRFACVATIVFILRCSPALSQTPEYRAQWVDAFHTGYLSAAQVTTTVANLRAANSNVFIPEVRVYSDAYYIPHAAHYTSHGANGTIYSHGVPMTMDLGSEPEPRANSSFDHLADIISKSHGGAKPLEVWAWLVSFRTGATMRARHPSWLTRNSAGDDVTADFDPGHPGVVQQLVNVCMDIVSNYDVDGLNFDYIRFTDSANGYNPVSVARFNARHNRTGLPANNDPLWKQWRRDQVTNAVRKIYLNVINVRPDVRISVDAITWAPGPNRPAANDPNPRATWKANFERQTSAYNSIYQDWRSWMEEGIIDIALTMNYFRECTHKADYDKWSDFTKENQFGRQGMNGPGTYLNSLDDSLSQLERTRLPSSPGGYEGAGQALYAYASPYANACGGTIVADPAGMSAALSGGAAGHPALYPTTAPLPALPRLTNGKGHLMGTVTRFGSPAPGWIDGAVVTVTGPVTRSIRTDGTGWYGFVDLPPGTYTLSLSADGMRNIGGAVAVTPQNVKIQNVIMQPDTSPARLEFSVSPSGAREGLPFTTQPMVNVYDALGNLATDFTGNVTLALKTGTGSPGAILLGSTTAQVVNGVATFADLAVDRPGASYRLTASSGSLTPADSAPFDVVRLGIPTETFRRAGVLPNSAGGSDWSLSGVGVNRNPGSPYYGYVYLANRLAGVNRVQIARPEPATMGTAADAYVDTGLAIQMPESSLSPWDAAVGPDDTVWAADLGGRFIYSAPPVPTSGASFAAATLQADLSAVSSTGGPRGLTVTGPASDASIYTAWYTDSRAQRTRVQGGSATQAGTAEILWSKTLNYSSGPYGVAVDLAGNAYLPKNLGTGSTASAFQAFGPDGRDLSFTAVIPAWAMSAASTLLQDAAFVPDASYPGGGYLYYSARVTVGGANKVIVHRFDMGGTWLDGFGPEIAGAPAAYTVVDIPASTTSTVAYMDADDRGNVYVLGMADGQNAVIKVARNAPITMADAARALNIAAGLETALPWDAPRLDVSAPAGVDLADALILARSLAG